MRNYLVVRQQFDRIRFCSKRNAKETFFFLEKFFYNVAVKVFRQAMLVWYCKNKPFNFTGEIINAKMCEIEEVTVIYCDIKTEVEQSQRDAKEILYLVSKTCPSLKSEFEL